MDVRTNTKEGNGSINYGLRDLASSIFAVFEWLYPAFEKVPKIISFFCKTTRTQFVMLLVFAVLILFSGSIGFYLKVRPHLSVEESHTSPPLGDVNLSVIMPMLDQSKLKITCDSTHLVSFDIHHSFLLTHHIEIPGKEFAWASNGRSLSTLTVWDGKNDIGSFPIKLATLPDLSLVSDSTTHGFAEYVRNLNDPGRRINEEASRLGLNLAEAYVADQNVIQFDASKLRDRFPSDLVLLDPEHSEMPLTLERGRFKFDGKFTPADARYWVHNLFLMFHGKRVKRFTFLRRISDIVDKMSIPSGKAAFWSKDPHNMGLLRAGPGVRAAGKGNPPYYNVFSQSRIPLERGLYVLELEFRSVGNGALAVPFTPWCVAIVPAGPGKSVPALEFAGDLGCRQAGPPDQYFENRPVIHDCKKSKGCRLEYPDWQPLVNLKNDEWHTMTLIVSLSTCQTGFMKWQFGLYVDQAFVAEAARASAQMPAYFVPELRNYSSCDLEVQKMRLLHIPANTIR